MSKPCSVPTLASGVPEHLFDGSVEEYGEATWRYWQEVVNGDFPSPPLPGENVAEPIPVIARILWEKDGEESVH